MRRRLFAAVGCVMLFLSFQAIAQVQGKWATTTNNLPSPVQLNTQVLLLNGDVLVAGGSNGSGYLATAQLYNPVTRLWTATGSMTTARQYFAAVVLPNGRVLVEGGQGTGGAILASAELYTPSTGKWTPAGHMSVARFSHTATLISTASGPKVLVTGGCNTPTCSTATGVSELYDPVLNNWTTTGALHIPRAYQTATRLLNGKVLIVGGVSASSTKSCELYDPTHGTWTVVASTSVLRNQHAAALLSSGKVLVAGGNCGRCANFSAEIYDPTLNSWTATGNMTKGRFGHSATTLANNTVLIAAGGTFVGRYYFPT
ncbi:MAG TPA: kelch repeat-containing protein, partial [Candidatus Methylomirabilis sp.]|nr:kelch repeat-containing protein [Candidatus Methylomirabilis sp.]